MKIKRIALLLPNTDTTLETDLYRELNCVVHTHRMWLEDVSKEAEKRMVDQGIPEALKYLKGIAEFDFAIFGCTSASAVYGSEGLKRIEADISNELNCPAVTALGAVLKQLEALNVSKIALLTPYTQQVNSFVQDTMSQFGYTISFCAGLGISDDCLISKVTPKSLMELVKTHKEDILNSGAEVVFFSCTNLRAMEIIGETEKLLNLPIISSNYSIIQRALETGILSSVLK